MMTPEVIYSMRNMNLLAVPAAVLDIIGSMQLAPVAQVFPKKPGFKKPNYVPSEKAGSWRSDAIVMMKKMEFKKDDPDFEVIVGITNKVSAASLSESANKVIDILKKRADDQVFRLRIVTLLFDRGVSMPFYSKLVANMFELINVQVPVIRDDLQFSCSLESFNKMFDQSETIMCPSSEDADYEDKLCKWAKMKEIRRGFGMFITELHIRNLVDESVILGAMNMAADELEESVRKPVDKTLSESVDQLVTLLYETCKIVITRYGKEHPIVKLLMDRSKHILSIPKAEAPCMGMRSKFKLEDIQKL